MLIAAFFLLQVQLISGGDPPLDKPVGTVTQPTQLFPGSTKQEDLTKLQDYLDSKQAEDIATKTQQDLMTHQPEKATGFEGSVALEASKATLGFLQGTVVDTVKSTVQGGIALAKAKVAMDNAVQQALIHPIDTYNKVKEGVQLAKDVYDTGAVQKLAAATGQLIKAGAEAAWNHPSEAAHLVADGMKSTVLSPCTGASASSQGCGRLVGNAAMWLVPYAKVAYLSDALKATSLIRSAGGVVNKIENLNATVDRLTGKVEKLTNPGPAP
jgi:hypothetical protein